MDAARSGVLAALDLLPTTVWVLDAQGQLLSANRAGRELDRMHDGVWIGRDGRPAAAAVFVFDPERIESPDTQVLGSLYGLTGTEAKLAVSLARGESLEDYCRANRVTANAARAHLKRALAKTGTHRQAQLVSLLARLPKAGALSGH